MIRQVRALVAVLCLLPLGAGAEPSASDAAVAPAQGQITVVLKSGAVFRGTFLGRDERTIQLRSAGGTTREIPLEAVARVESGDLPATAAATSAPAAAERMRFGLGVSVSTRDAAALYFPMQTESVRIEPGISLVLRSREGADSTVLGLGVGVFGLGRLGDKGRTDYGVRLSLAHASLQDGGSSGEIWTFRLAPAFGIEWIPDDRMAVGVEGQAGFAFGQSTFVLDVTGLLFVRVFVP